MLSLALSLSSTTSELVQTDTREIAAEITFEVKIYKSIEFAGK
jgi:hypothetical protein